MAKRNLSRVFLACLFFLIGQASLLAQSRISVNDSFGRQILTELRTPNRSDTVSWNVLLTNASSESMELVLEMRNPFLRHIELRWIPEGHAERLFITGAERPFRERPLLHRYFAFPLTLQPGESAKLELDIQNRGYRDRVVVELFEKKAFDVLGAPRTLVITTYFSATLFTLVFGFIILAVSRAFIRFSFIYYFSIGLILVATLQGLTFQYLWPNQPWFQGVAKPILLNATFLGGFRFLQRFFNSDRQLDTINRIIYFLMFGLGLFAAAALATPYLAPSGLKFYQTFNDSWFLACILMVAIIPPVYYYRTRLPEALWFLVAYAVLMAAVFTGIGSGFGWFHTGPALDAWILAGVLILHMVVSGVIMNRMRRVVLDQARARQELEMEKIRQLRDLVIQEELERERIGADLHDEAGSRFAAMKMALSGEAYNEKDSGRSQALETIIEEIDRICDVNRTISHRLLSVSLNQVGLLEALGEYQMRLRTKGRHVVFRYASGTLDGLSETAEILIYRVVLEVVEGLYEQASTFRVLLENSADGMELVLTAQPLDEDLPAVDPASVTLNSLRTRLALFSATRDEPLQFLETGVRVWVPKSVESLVRVQE